MIFGLDYSFALLCKTHIDLYWDCSSVYLRGMGQLKFHGLTCWHKFDGKFVECINLYLYYKRYLAGRQNMFWCRYHSEALLDCRMQYSWFLYSLLRLSDQWCTIMDMLSIIWWFCWSEECCLGSWWWYRRVCQRQDMCSYCMCNSARLSNWTTLHWKACKACKLIFHQLISSLPSMSHKTHSIYWEFNWSGIDRKPFYLYCRMRPQGNQSRPVINLSRMACSKDSLWDYTLPIFERCRVYSRWQWWSHRSSF